LGSNKIAVRRAKQRAFRPGRVATPSPEPRDHSAHRSLTEATNCEWPPSAYPRLGFFFLVVDYRGHGVCRRGCSTRTVQAKRPTPCPKTHFAAGNFDRDQSAAHPQFAFLIGRVFRLRGYRCARQTNAISVRPSWTSWSRASCATTCRRIVTRSHGYATLLVRKISNEAA